MQVGDKVRIVKDCHPYLTRALYHEHNKVGMEGEIWGLSKHYATVRGPTIGTHSSHPDFFCGKWALKHLVKI